MGDPGERQQKQLRHPQSLAHQRIAGALLALAALTLLACGQSPHTAPSPEPLGVEKQYEAGGLTVTLRVSRQQLTAADRLELTLEAEADEGASIGFPTIEDKLGEFQVLNSSGIPAKLVPEGRLRTGRAWELEPFLPGDYEIPSLTISYGPPTDGQEQRPAVKTDPIPIEVTSVLPDTEGEPDIKDIASPVGLPSQTPWWAYALGGGAVGSLLALAYYLRRRKRGGIEASEPPLPPHERAYRALDRLLAEDLLTRGESKIFYLRLSGILRHYIEDRFGLRAPERTTEEFLHELRTSDDLKPAHKDRLKQFLVHCDMVKFAEHQPEREETDTAVGVCRQFVDETKVVPETATPAGPVTPSEPVSLATSESTGRR